MTRDVVHLEPTQVPASLKAGYNGKMFKAVVTNIVTIPATAGLWDGGSRDTFTAVRMSDGATVPFPGQQSSPWDNNRADRTVTLPAGTVVRVHSIFCGKDYGLTFYLHPTDAAPLLPAPLELDAMEALVLEYTISRKSSYNGRDRYQMAQDDMRYGDGDLDLTRANWDAAKARLITRGLLNRAGAVTTAGRNARGR